MTLLLVLLKVAALVVGVVGAWVQLSILRRERLDASWQKQLVRFALATRDLELAEQRAAADELGKLWGARMGESLLRHEEDAAEARLWTLRQHGGWLLLLIGAVLGTLVDVVSLVRP